MSSSSSASAPVSRTSTPRSGTGLTGRPRPPSPKGKRSRTLSYPKLARQNKAPEPALQQQKIPTYWLDWNKLKEILEGQIYPGSKFDELLSVENSYFVINVPRPLKPEDEALIENARVKPKPLQTEEEEEPTAP